MDTRKSMIWIGAAMLGAVVLTAALPARQGGMPALNPVAEPDLFPFLKPLDSSALSVPQPAASRDTQLTPTNIAGVEAAAQNMRAQGAGDDQIYRLRADALSPDMADRLAQLDRAEKTWNARVNDYIAERDRLRDGTAAASDEQKIYALQQLRDSRFTAEEQIQLGAYETGGSPRLMQ
ncbi:MAG: hypothetical protein A3I66_10975 [Burkholderiales bacterium RIFCSPLOWO2_02_FULL_57_36]|nr:MAG: hypothetical protein A3I66_10975 [Burkholderiales bacterium RIFCSPLOWO2_02_FULL_57_36]